MPSSMHNSPYFPLVLNSMHVYEHTPENVGTKQLRSYHIPIAPHLSDGAEHPAVILQLLPAAAPSLLSWQPATGWCQCHGLDASIQLGWAGHIAQQGDKIDVQVTFELLPGSPAPAQHERVVKQAVSGAQSGVAHAAMELRFACHPPASVGIRQEA